MVFDGAKIRKFQVEMLYEFQGHYISRKKDRGGRDGRSKLPPRTAHC